MFKLVNWKLFNQQINGGLSECCDATVNDVVYADINSAAKINAGTDIINCLPKPYGVSAPIFIDNAESVTKYLDTESQVIKLYVSEADISLSVESEE